MIGRWVTRQTTKFCIKFINTFDKHTKEPEKTVDAYIKEKKLELGEWVNQRRKVYLDTKFWLLLRDAHLDRAKMSEALEPAAVPDADAPALGGRSTTPRPCSGCALPGRTDSGLGTGKTSGKQRDRSDDLISFNRTC